MAKQHTTINEIGPYKQQLPIGAIQTTTFTNNDAGIFGLTRQVELLKNTIRVLM